MSTVNVCLRQLVNKFGQDIIPTNNENCFKRHNSRELHGIWLVIELGQGIKPTNIAINMMIH